jgi:hypothetical protein
MHNDASPQWGDEETTHGDAGVANFSEQPESVNLPLETPPIPKLLRRSASYSTAMDLGAPIDGDVAPDFEDGHMARLSIISISHV